MKVGIVGVGAVGTSCAKAMLLRGSCHEMVLIEKENEAKQKLAKGVATDLSHGSALCPKTRIHAGKFSDLSDASVVVITAGINERTGKAIDRKDPRGRLLLLPDNARVYAEVVPQIAREAPGAILLVVTDPPDPLADVARRYTNTNPVISAGTYLDTLRFQIQIAKRLKCDHRSVVANVIGEHGTSQVYAWSSAQVGGRPVTELIDAKEREQVEKDVKFANIDIIEGTGASQHGIGIVSARITEAILRDERSIAPVGVLQPSFGVTFSLPSTIGREGVHEVLMPSLSGSETERLEASADAIRAALDDLRPSFQGETLTEIIPAAPGQILDEVPAKKTETR